MHDRIAEILDGQGYECEVRPGYPCSDGECDLLVRGNGLRGAWLEVKGAWRNLFANDDKDCNIRRRQNPNFGAHIERAAKDVDKLLHGVRTEHTSHVGVVLVCFGSPHFPILDEHLAVVGSRAVGWTEYTDRWPDHAWLPGEIRCGFWCRER
jgi:hypothetical protein